MSLQVCHGTIRTLIILKRSALWGEKNRENGENNSAEVHMIAKQINSPITNTTNQINIQLILQFDNQ